MFDCLVDLKSVAVEQQRPHGFVVLERCRETSRVSTRSSNQKFKHSKAYIRVIPNTPLI